MRIIIYVFLSAFSLTAYTKGVDFALPWKGKIINGQDDIDKFSPVVSIRNRRNIPIFAGVIISKYHVLSAASATYGYEMHPNYKGIYVFVNFLRFNIKYMESYPNFDPSLSDFDISFITVSFEMPSDFICTLLAPPGSCNLGGFNDFILRAFDNTPYYHMRHQSLTVQTVPYTKCSLVPMERFRNHRAFCIASLDQGNSFEQRDLGAGIFYNGRLFGILSKLPESPGVKGYIITALGNDVINNYIHLAWSRSEAEREQIKNERIQQSHIARVRQ